MSVTQYRIAVVISFGVLVIVSAVIAVLGYVTVDWPYVTITPPNDLTRSAVSGAPNLFPGLSSNNHNTYISLHLVPLAIIAGIVAIPAFGVLMTRARTSVISVTVSPARQSDANDS